MAKDFPTIIDILPRPLFTDFKECSKAVEEAHQYLHGRGKEITNSDEVSFLICIDRYIHFFERAKSMLANDRFTVKYRGGRHMLNPDLIDYEIISLSKEDEKGL